MIQKIFLILCLSLIVCTANADSLRKPRKRTPTTNKITLIQALEGGYIQVFNKKPNINTLSMSLAQINLENGHGKYIYNYNLGNVGPRWNQRVPYFILGGSMFKAHNTYTEGAVSYWLHLKEVCSKALPYFSKGDPTTASHVMRRCKYYTAPRNHYTKLLVILFSPAKKLVKKHKKIK
tara:strand:+ start:1671 stop:2204 length:534 start_codon:yes stop_codon:yes gene_type:complete